MKAVVRQSILAAAAGRPRGCGAPDQSTSPSGAIDVGRADQRLALRRPRRRRRRARSRGQAKRPSGSARVERNRRVEDEIVADQPGRVIVGAVIIVGAQQEAALAASTARRRRCGTTVISLGRARDNCRR